LFQRRLDNKNTIKRESKTTGGDQVKNEQQSDRGHDQRPEAGSEICSKLAVLFDNIHLSRVRTLPVGENHEKASMVFTLNFSAEKHEKSP